MGVLQGCSGNQVKGQTAAEVLFKEAQSLVERERYLLATEKLNALRSQYPYSFYATPAELLQADILFKQESYAEAAASYKIFRDLHPRHKEIPYVIWQTAESYYRQLPDTFDRDLTPAKEAMRIYQDIIKKFPESERVESASKRIEECRVLLRKKDKYIADFYFKTKAYDAAQFRYLDILKSYPDNEGLVKNAKERLVQSSLLSKKYEDCIFFGKKYANDGDDKYQNQVKSWVSTCTEKLSMSLKKN